MIGGYVLYGTYIDCLYSFSVASYIWTLRLARDVLACSNVYKDWRFLCGLRGSGYNILWIRTLRSKMENKWKQWFDAIPPFWNSIWLPPPCRSELNPFWLPLQLQVQTTKKNTHWSYWPGAGEALRTIAKDVATGVMASMCEMGQGQASILNLISTCSILECSTQFKGLWFLERVGCGKHQNHHTFELTYSFFKRKWCL